MNSKTIYKCLKCRNVFEENDIVFNDQRRFDYYSDGRSIGTCPHCGYDEFYQTWKCEICGEEYFFEDDVCGCEHHICHECLDDYKHDFETCYKVSEEEKPVKVELNALLATLFSETEIEQILREYIATHWEDVDCSEYLFDDPDWFVDTFIKMEGD